MGIEQLVDSFLGNPKPLEAKVERDNKGQPPGAIPKDLEEAIALQKIAELQKGAQNQQAMQAGGAQPSVVQKLQQMLAMAQQRQQAQMPQQMPGQMPQGTPRPMVQQPVMAASGGSLDQLMSNLARHYAGGGIVAFNGEDDSDVKDETEPRLRQVTQRELAEEYNRKRWAQQAEDEKRTSMAGDVGRALKAAAEGIANPISDAWGNLSERQKIRQQLEQNRPGFFEGLTDEERAARQAKAQGLVGQLNKLVEGKSTPATPLADIRSQLNAAEARMQPAAPATPAAPVKDLAALATQKQRAQNAAAAGTANASTPQQAVDPASLRGLIEANIRKELGKDEDVEWQKGAKRHEEFMGLDKLLQPKEARIAEREALLKKAQGERLPSWVEGFSRASRPVVSGGLGTILNQMGSGMEDQRKAYNAEDLKFFDEIAAAKDEVAKLKMEGKYKAAAAGEASIKDAIANKRQAESSGTSLLNTDEMAATRRQMAKDAAAARIAAATARGDAGADKQQLAELKALQASKTAQLKTAFGTEKKRLQGELATIEAAIAKMAGLDTMAAAPGAGSPGGTSKPGWGIKPI